MCLHRSIDTDTCIVRKVYISEVFLEKGAARLPDWPQQLDILLNFIIDMR